MSRWKTGLLTITLAANLLMLALICTPLTNRLYAAIEVEPDVRWADAILLLSAGHHGPNIFNRNAYQRMMHAFFLYRQGLAPKIVICGGIIDDGDVPVSEYMKRFLVAIGVPEQDILTERRSRNTYENIAYARELLQRQNLGRTLLVTSSYHMFRSRLVCRKLNVQAWPAPVECYEKKINDAGTRSQFVFEILREYGAIVYFKLRGWI